MDNMCIALEFILKEKICIFEGCMKFAVSLVANRFVPPGEFSADSD
jgi:hypothetical protein